MFIFNEVIQKFVAQQQQALKKIEKEIILSGGPTLGNLKVLVHENDKFLGLYYPSQNKISLDISLLYRADEKIIDEVLRHEVAHHLVYREYGLGAKSHGKEFKEKCDLLKIPSSSTLNVREKMKESKDRQLLEKVQKLLKLGSSSNTHESELALLKANEILLNNNLKLVQEIEDQVYMVPVFELSQRNAKYRSIATILETFNVYAVWSVVGGKRCPYSGAVLEKGKRVLQISGDKTSVEIALWVGKFLETEMDRLWKKESKEKGLRGRVAKNSFYRGVCSGYKDKVLNLRSPEVKEKALVITSQVEKMSKKYLYKSVRTSKPKAKTDNNSYELGKQRGQSLNFNKPIKADQKDKKLLK